MSENALVSVSKARKYLAEAKQAKDLAGVLDLKDKAAALEHYRKLANESLKSQNEVAEIRVRSERCAGEILAGMESVRPGRPKKNGNTVLPFSSATLEDIGVSKIESSRLQAVAAVPIETFETYLDKQKRSAKEITSSDLQKLGRKEKAQQAREKEKREAAKKVRGIDVPEFVAGDFRDVAQQLADESVDLIFTDPPYDRKSLELYVDAAAVAARVLKPGGSLLMYCGQYLLPQILSGIASMDVDSQLRLWWIAAVRHAGSKARMTEYGIVVHWKPVLWYVKGTRGDKLTFVDDMVSGAEEKSHHPWQQSVIEAEYFVAKLSQAGGFVFDPFCGGGTTAVACKRLKRQCLTCDVDADQLQVAKLRYMEECSD